MQMYPVEEAIRAQKALREAKDWLFPGERPDHPLFQNAVRVACQKLRKKLGISKPLSPHYRRPPGGREPWARYQPFQ